MLSGKVLITGASGMVAQHLLEKLTKFNVRVFPIYHSNVDLRDARQCDDIVGLYKPDYLFAMQGYNGNIEKNLKEPADIFYNSTIMSLNVLNSCSKYKVKKVIQPLTSCGFPSRGGRLKEEDYLDGRPDLTTECHGFSKRAAFIYALQLHKQHGLNVINIIANNMYGEHDRFDQPDRLKVAGALIKKFVDAKRTKAENVILFGTGEPRRELLYAGDAAEGLIQAALKYEDSTSPLSIGTGVDISIRELAGQIKNLTGFLGEIVWDTSKPNGQMQKLLDVTKMQKALAGWYPKTSLQEGLLNTIRHYEGREQC